MILNLYKSYITDNLYVRSTAVPAVTAGQSDEYLGGGGYRNIPANVILFYPEKLSFDTRIIFYPQILPQKLSCTTPESHPLRSRLSHDNTSHDSLYSDTQKEGRMPLSAVVSIFHLCFHGCYNSLTLHLVPHGFLFENKQPPLC